MANRNEIAFRLNEKQSRNYFDYGALRKARSFNYNNYERAINDISGRVTTNQSQRLAVSQNFGNTRGLIIGGQRDRRPTIASSGAPILVQSVTPTQTASGGGKVQGGRIGSGVNPRRLAEEQAAQRKKFKDLGLPAPF